MTITDKISKHYQSSIGGELQKVRCEEWDTDIYFRTTYPLKDEGKILELQTQGKTVEALVETLITKARKEDGSKMFTIHDKATFMNEVDPSVVIRVCGEMNQSLDSNLEIVEKN